MTGSSSKHTHDHGHGHDDDFKLPARNPHANISPTERLERLFMFLEAQFGSDALTPIETPKISSHLILPAKDQASDTVIGDAGSDNEAEGEDMKEAIRLELERLHKAGIPVPGIEIKVDKMVAKVWLEDLEIECAHRVFGDRVRAVVERAVEVIAPLWG
jgi:cleavage and polyadenylation specificity factor subunit 3